MDINEMATRNGIIDDFMRGATRGKASSLSIDGDILKSYATPIALRKDGQVFVNMKKYSSTTSTQQNALVRSGGEQVDDTQFNQMLDDIGAEKGRFRVSENEAVESPEDYEYNVNTHLSPEDAQRGENYQKFIKTASPKLIQRFEALQDNNYHTNNGEMIATFLYALDKGASPQQAEASAWAYLDANSDLPTKMYGENDMTNEEDWGTNDQGDEMDAAEAIGTSFINGNISWVRGKIRGKAGLALSVQSWLSEYSPEDASKFKRVMMGENIKEDTEQILWKEYKDGGLDRFYESFEEYKGFVERNIQVEEKQLEHTDIKVEDYFITPDSVKEGIRDAIGLTKYADAQMAKRRENNQ